MSLKTGIKDMTNSKLCPACDIEYETTECIPKVLTCGHTICLKCLSGLIKDIKICPKCAESFEGPISKFPTNFVLLDIENKDTIKDLELKKKEIGKRLKEERRIFEKNFKIMKNTAEELNSCLETVKSWSDIEIESYEEYQNMVKDMEEKLRDLDHSLYECYNPYIKADFSLRYEDGNKDEFMNKIVLELLKGNIMYAFNSEWYNEDIFWGRMSYDNGKLYIHSFTSDIPTTKCLLVPLGDLKNCLEQYNFQTFIDIHGNKIVCNMISSSKLSQNFIKLCTGEDGTSFKGLTSAIKPFSKKGEETMILKIKLPQKDSEENYDALESLPLETKETTEDGFQIKMWDEKCEIVKYSKFQSSKKIESDGVVVASARSSAEAFLYPYNSNDDGPPVKDCGLILTFLKPKRTSGARSQSNF